MARTHNNDFAYDSTGNALLEFFSKAGSLFAKKGTYYGDETKAVELFKSAWVTNNYKAMQLSMWLRDCRGGAGNRSGFREILKWLVGRDASWVEANMHMIPLVGRWDDLESLVDTPCEKNALDFWVRAIQDGNQLAAKWAPREDKNKAIFAKMRKICKMSPKDFRKLLVKNTNVVETVMCQKEWQDIDFNKVPSVAMARYNNAFKKHDPARFGQWKDALEKGVDEDGNEVKVNTSVLFPHDVIRTLYADLSDSHGGYYGFTSSRRSYVEYKDSKIANAQFAALPDYMEGTNARIMAICDFSGSMTNTVSGQIRAIDVSMSLGLYCSDRLGEKNPFYRKFMPFSNDSHMVDWKNDTFSVAAQKYNDGFVGSTNIRSALDKILEAAKMFGATNEQIPNMLLVISDMQFDGGVSNGSETTVETAMKEWEKAGYTRPKIVYWNTAGYAGTPSTKVHNNVALVSGFSPSLLKAVLGGEDFNPMAILDRAIAKYKVVDPNDPERGSKEAVKIKSEPKSDIVNDESDIVNDEIEVKFASMSKPGSSVRAKTRSKTKAKSKSRRKVTI